MKKEVSTKKLVKTIIICVVFAALLAGLIYLMVSDQTYGTPDSLKIGQASFGERLLIGLQVAFLGLATVFMMLVLLIIAVNIIRLILMGVAKLGEKKSAAKVVSQPSALDVEEVCEDDEIVAAITAAIMAYYEADGEDGESNCKSNLKFRVRSIKEI